MSPSSTSEAAFFEAKYLSHPDPWDFENSTYERSRYHAILQSLSGGRYRSALEPGCSVGVLTEGLAGICDHVLAIDFSPTAAQSAAQRCAALPNVQVQCASLDDIPSFAPFDLIVLSEIGYYFPASEWTILSHRIISEMTKGATLLAAHWLGTSTDHEISGDRVHEILLSNPHLNLQAAERHERFRLERWERS